MNVEEIILLVTQEVMKRLEGIEEDQQVNASKKILVADCYQDSYKNLEELLSIKGFFLLTIWRMTIVNLR